MSKYFTIVKSNYDNGLWSEARVHNAVEKGWITEDEFELIVGRPYSS